MHEVFSAERSLNQPKATRVCMRSINQSNRYISVRLLFLFCSPVFISRSYENRSNEDVDYDDDDTGKDNEDEHDYDHREPQTSGSHVTTCRQVIELFLIEKQF